MLIDVANPGDRNVIKKITENILKYKDLPISRPTDATCDRFLFSIYMCITLYVSSVKRSSSGVPLFAALSCKKLTRECRRQTQTQKLEAVCTVRDS
jgi:hypothetical protein